MVLERVKSFAVRRPDAFIIGVWTLVVVAAFLPYFIVGGWSPKFYQWMSETTLLHVPHWNFTGGMLKAGLVPTWTPHVSFSIT